MTDKTNSIAAEIDRILEEGDQEISKSHFTLYNATRPPVDDEKFQAVCKDLKAFRLNNHGVWMAGCPICNRRRAVPTLLVPSKNYFGGYYCTCQGTIDQLYELLNGPSRPKRINRLSRGWSTLDVDRKTPDNADARPVEP